MTTLAIDIGGTFTDVALQDATGRLWRAKTPSTPHDPSEAFLIGATMAMQASGAPASAIARVLHGTTVATNLILENRGARTALVTTAGFRHVLEIGRQDIPRRANLYAWIKPQRPVPPSRVLEVAERVGPGGEVLLPLDEASVAAAAEACRALGVEAVAICLLHSFAAPAHERRVAALLTAALPGVAVTASVNVLPVVREYERSLAAILNAQVMPAIATYVERLERRLAGAGIDARLLLMKSNGGVAGSASIRRTPAVTALSGPAAGVVGAREAAAAAGVHDLITIDIGGTSADICLIEGGRIGLTAQGRVGEWPLPLPMVDMITVGAGGGSIAQVADGALTVGPASAGAAPGPACYGRGGTRATVTDAHVVLGHQPLALLDGRMTLDAGAAAAAVQAVAGPLGLSLHEAARGILAIVDNNMVGAIRVVSVERGRDPRDFTLLAFGGAGPLHGCALADLLGCPRVLIPAAPGVLCAEGLLASDLRAEFSRTTRRAADPADGELDDLFTALTAEALAWFDEERVAAPDRATHRTALMRYAGQGGELPIAWPGATGPARAAFHAAHRALYGFTLDAAVELVTLRIEAVGRRAAAPAGPVTAAPAAAAFPDGVIHLAAGPRAAPVLARAGLAVGQAVAGPAILVQPDSTVLVAPGWSATPHASGALIMERTG